MKKIIFDVIAQYLMWICDLTHLLPYEYEEKLQGLFINIFGYHCPFATWAFIIDENFGSNRWLVKK